MPYENILVTLGAKPSGINHWMALCPAHDDRNPSLSITLSKDGKLLVKCFAGCTTEKILSVIGLTFKDLFLNKSSNHCQNPKRVSHVYEYTDEYGNLLFQCIRFHPKGFAQRRLGPDGKWIYNLNGVRLVPYKLPEILKSVRVFIVEGEKDVETLRMLGFVATCNPMGAGKWEMDYGKYLSKKEVIIVPDSDAPGEKHAASVIGSCLLHGVKELRLLRLHSKDISDYVFSRKEKLSCRQIVSEINDLVNKTCCWMCVQ